MNPLRDLLVFLVIVAVLAGLWFLLIRATAIRLLQRRQPDPPDPPSNYNLAFEEVHFTSRDRVKLFGWWIPADNAIGTIVLCHGQRGSMDGDTKQAVPLHEARFNVFMLHFPPHPPSAVNSLTVRINKNKHCLHAL